MTHAVPRVPEPTAVLAALADILQRVTRRPRPEVTMETPLEAVDGLDSLRLLETVALAEERFGVIVDTGGLGQIETLGDIVRLVSAGRPA